MNKEDFSEEADKLQEIIAKFNEVMEYYNLRLDAIPKIYKDNPLMIANFIELYSRKISLMKRTIKKPYFARIDFARDGEKNVEKLYIGKVGVMDEDNNNITIDWRAPISSMYYDSNLGRTSYEAPEGTCTGEILVKRQYEIEDGKLQSFQDVDTVSNDDLLKPYLEASVDNRLRNIVSTIQVEQNAIIREPIAKNVIVQGVAGSGKTTVALHRIAYLVYNNREKINPEQYLVIGPNKFFVNYIFSVLPDLDVDNVNQLTYLELCQKSINEKIHLINEEEKLIKSITDMESLEYERFKVSMRFKEALDKYVEQIDKSIVPDEELVIKGYRILPQEIIRKIYNSIGNNIIYNSIEKKIERVKLLLDKYIEKNNVKLERIIKRQYREKIEELSEEEKREEILKLEYVEKELKTNFRASIKKYFNFKTKEILNLYYDFLSNITKYVEIEKINDWENKLKNNIANIKKKKVEFEDLSALIYLKVKIVGTEEYDDYRQIAIDEAQDYGEFSFYALRILFRRATFSIFGDLAQSIYQYRGIKNWNEVLNTTFEGDCELKYLLKSYRTTTEIMNSANNITKHINLEIAKPVIRHGENVEYIRYEKNQIDLIEKIIKEYMKKAYVSIAIICKNDEEAKKIYKKLKEKNITATNIVDNENKYDGGICVITSYLAKGLEFDGVIITDASEEKYSSEKAIDMKLLYVAMTRPLHELKVLYQKDITKPLREEAKK